MRTKLNNLLRIGFFLGAIIMAQPVLAQLSTIPSNPTALDQVRLRWTHVGCTNADSVQVSMQSNRASVSVDRVFAIDCGTIQGYFEDYTIGRLPAGEYDVQLIVNPPPGTLGPSVLVGSVHFSVAPLPATGTLLPHENYSDMWWNPNESGQALQVYQSGKNLFAVWVVYDVSGRPIWYTLQPGAWARNANGVLGFSGPVYKTTGPYWGAQFDAAQVKFFAAGSATFTPQSVGQVRFDYSIDGVTGAKQLQRFVF